LCLKFHIRRGAASDLALCARAFPKLVFKSGGPSKTAGCKFYMSYDRDRDEWRVHYCFQDWRGPDSDNSFEGLPVIRSGDSVTMRYDAKPKMQLSLAVNSGSHVVADKLKPAENEQYSPFLQLGTMECMEVRTTSSKGELKHSLATAAGHGQRMWADREFTDAVIETGTGSILVHRAIICCLPQFKSAFDGGYHETGSCRVRIDDVSHDSVQAFVQVLYTGDLPDEVDYPEVLVLAHRYEHQELMYLCAWAIVHSLGGSNICEGIRFVRLFKDHPFVKPAWQMLDCATAEYCELREALLMAL